MFFKMLLIILVYFLWILKKKNVSGYFYELDKNLRQFCNYLPLCLLY
jgi:hypothetical protein